jgi:small redox-active disulfide protein 2
MEIKILGTGCPKCKKLYEETEKALAETGVPANLEKVEQITEIIKYGVALTPALVIDGEVKCAGKLPSTGEIAGWLASAAK